VVHVNGQMLSWRSTVDRRFSIVTAPEDRTSIMEWEANGLKSLEESGEMEKTDKYRHRNKA
jgi:hypothetical protein